MLSVDKTVELLNKVRILRLKLMGFVLDFRMSYGDLSRSYEEQAIDKL